MKVEKHVELEGRNVDSVEEFVCGKSVTG